MSCLSEQSHPSRCWPHTTELNFSSLTKTDREAWPPTPLLFVCLFSAISFFFVATNQISISGTFISQRYCCTKKKIWYLIPNFCGWNRLPISQYSFGRGSIGNRLGLTVRRLIVTATLAVWAIRILKEKWLGYWRKLNGTTNKKILNMISQGHLLPVVVVITIKKYCWTLKITSPDLSLVWVLWALTGIQAISLSGVQQPWFQSFSWILKTLKNIDNFFKRVDPWCSSVTHEEEEHHQVTDENPGSKRLKKSCIYFEILIYILYRFSLGANV